MSQFVQYIFYRNGPLSPLKIIRPADDKDFRTVEIVDHAVGFKFFEAENLEQAQKTKNEKAISYFLGNSEQVSYTHDMVESDPILGAFLAKTLEEKGFHRIFGNFPLRGISMRDQDVVIDPHTREIVHPPLII